MAEETKKEKRRPLTGWELITRNKRWGQWAILAVLIVSAVWASRSSCGGVARTISPLELVTVSDYPVRSLHAYQNQLWIGGGRGGVAVITQINGELRYEACGGPTFSSGFTVNDITDYQNQIYIATDKEGIWVWNNGPWQNFRTESNTLRDNRAYVLYQDATGSLLAGTYTGIEILEVGAETTLEALRTKLEFADQMAVHALLEYEGTWLVGTINNGLYRLTPSGELYHYDQTGISRWNQSRSVFEVVNGNLAFPSQVRDLEFIDNRLVAFGDSGDQMLNAFYRLDPIDPAIVYSQTGTWAQIVRVNYLNNQWLVHDYVNATFAFELPSLQLQSISDEPSYDAAFFAGYLILATDSGLHLVSNGSCGNGVCQMSTGENTANCPADCGTALSEEGVNFCGDGICNAAQGESYLTCSADCGTQP